MIVVKILERQGVIRLFGIALFLSPFFNTLASMAMRPDGPDKWTGSMFFKIITTGNIADHLLYLASVSIGLMMVSGSSKVWKAVLVLLGGHILRQLLQLGENIRTHWVYGLFFIVNVSIFLFIADQLVWKQKKPIQPTSPQPKPQQKTQAQEQLARPSQPRPSPQVPPPAPAASTAPVAPSKPRTASARASRRILIHFDGVGPWAQLMSVSQKGILVRSIAEPPPQIESREIEISVKNGLRLRTRLARHSAQDYFFEYTELTHNEVRLLNQWLQSQAA